MAKKPRSEHIEFVKEGLSKLKENLDSIDTYLSTHSWQQNSDFKGIDDAFKFHAELTKNYIKWLKEYAELSGIIEYYESQNTEEKMRKNFSESPIEELMKRKDEQ